MCSTKETGFFFEDYDKGLDWYFSEYFSHFNGEYTVGEEAGDNMFHEEVAPRIAEHFPEARLVFLLRDPVERLYSHYRFDVHIGCLPPTADFSNLIRDETSQWRNEMIERGMYYRQLQNYSRHFGGEHMNIVLFSDFVNKTDSVLGNIFSFIGVNSKVDIDTEKVYNKTLHIRAGTIYRSIYRVWEPVKSRLPKPYLENLFDLRSTVRGMFFDEDKQKPSMDAADRWYLEDIYSEPNSKLEEWLGRDLSHWT